MMPHEMFTNLSEVARKEVYEKLRESYLRRNPGKTPPSINFFYSVWKSNCSSIRTRRNHGFAKCQVCLYLKAEMANNQKNLVILRSAKASLREHFEMVREERRQYTHRIERATRDPSKYFSMVVDGADQNAYGLPHFIDKSKSDRGHKIKVKCVGLLQHSGTKKLRLFMMTEEFATGANHIIELVHRSLTDHKNETGRFPPVLYIQVDNCSRENKNRYFFCYLEMLVSLGVFLEVEVSFLPVGHTHTDIDQSFSSVARVLKHKDAPTLPDLVRIAKTCYNTRTSIERLDRIANFSGLCEETKCVVTSRMVRGFLERRHFRFTRAGGDRESEGGFRTQCFVKVQSRDNWEPLSLRPVKGLLKFIPDLRETPTTETHPPDNVTEVNQHLMSLHGRNRKDAPAIIASLSVLRDVIYKTQVHSFHWNLESCFELNGDFVSNDFVEEETAWVESAQGGGDETIVEYETESFIAVKPDTASRSRFWIAMVLNFTDRSPSNNLRCLRVLWYSCRTENGDEFSARYVPSQVYDSRRKGYIPYEDQVHVDTVLLHFPSLNSHGYLRASTSSALRRVLCLN